MTKQNTVSTHEELFNGWRRQAWLQRILLPGDFLSHVSATGGAEILQCNKTTTEYLAMGDKVEVKTVKVRESRTYSTDVKYRPQEFRNQIVKIINNASEVQCPGCVGRGWLPCPTTMSCRRCGGSGRRFEECGMCGGSGEVHKDQWWQKDQWDNSGGTYVRCGSCGGNRGRTVNCGDCDHGTVVCDRCYGRGTVVCRRCDGDGKLVRANIITRKFSCSTEVVYQLSGLGENEFKNGLARKHFESMPGSLTYQEFRTPSKSNTVLERRSIHSYDVLSHQCSYQEFQFYLNKITSISGSKYVASKMPLSKIKIAVGGIILGLGIVAASVISAFIFLA